MNGSNLLFLFYLHQNGIITNYELQNIKLKYPHYNLENLMKKIKDILLIDNNKKERCDNIFDKFVELDNNKIKSLLKKLYLIYIRKIRMLKFHYFYEWNKKINLLIDNKSNYRKKTNFNPQLMIQNCNSCKNINNKITKTSHQRAKSSYDYKQITHLSLLKEMKPIIKKKKKKDEINYKVIPIPQNKLHKLTPIEKKKFFYNLSNSNIFKQEKIQKLRENLNKDYEKKFTFSPNLISKKNKNSNKINHNTINQNHFNTITTLKKDRLRNNGNYNINYSNYIKNKKEKLEKILSDMIIENGITFKPKLNDNYNSKTIKESFNERYNNYMKNRENELFNDKSSTPEIDKECTFSPKININYFPHNYILQTPFEQRLEYYQKEYENHIKDIKNKYSKSFTFKPSTAETPSEKDNMSKIIGQNSLGDYDPKRITFSSGNYFENKNENQKNKEAENLYSKSEEIKEIDEDTFLYNSQ